MDNQTVDRSTLIAVYALLIAIDSNHSVIRMTNSNKLKNHNPDREAAKRDLKEAVDVE